MSEPISGVGCHPMSRGKVPRTRIRRIGPMSRSDKDRATERILPMLLIDRDFKRGGERFAIPSQGEVEGKLAVMEIVSIACLREVLRSKDETAIPKLRRKVLRT